MFMFFFLNVQLLQVIFKTDVQETFYTLDKISDVTFRRKIHGMNVVFFIVFFYGQGELGTIKSQWCLKM